jgi:hypothetical protein
MPAPSVLSLVQRAQAAVNAALAVGAASVPGAELTEAVSEASALEAQTAALTLALLAEADRREVATASAATSTDAWAAELTATTQAKAREGLWLAQHLEDTYAATREAFAAGGINAAQARAIVVAAEKLPRETSHDQRTAAEAGLVAKAVEGMDARGLRQAGRRMLQVVSSQLADQHEAQTLETEERRALNETWLALHDNGDGTYSGKFTIPELHGQMLRAALERLSAPRRRWTKMKTKNGDAEDVEDPTLDSASGGLSWSDRLGLAFVELIEHLPTTGHHPVAATLIVTLEHQRLLDQLASAGLETGTRISVAETRRLACGAGIIPAVLDGDSQPLDLGREQRLHNKAQRHAMSLRYQTCAAIGCQRPFAWCEIHHPNPWSEGGRTDLDNAVPLCGWHHHRAHDPDYTVTYLATGEVRYRAVHAGWYTRRIPRYRTPA